MERKYEFSWDLLGDVKEGRPNLGPMVRTEIYRLMQFCFRDVLETNYGSETADKLFYESGMLAGKQFYQNAMNEAENFNDFIKSLQSILADKAIGILRLETSDFEQGKYVLSISEDLDCSGLPELDYQICVYDEGFIAGLLESFTGKKFTVKEVDCWCTGDRTCRFVAKICKE
ncbi:MAG TPA: 4-vinyl reductase [Methylomusa anaerophila]|uniref:V4R domain protein n=1 Tax=Methylomusa anaerophila TaxID=1930071 RepID=A0A348AIM3_9FIRM|nr:4-vinyl reductase [Methylomusa anaerophila]BBB90921.1 V4R domain protein [Methylomusa anaerophila]HML90676.1 4-vinyl reductase [Methylomusa anaerophila]